MEIDFRALQVIAEVALGIVGFSAILIALSRAKDGFSAPDNFRVQLLTYSAFGAMFCALIPFAIFNSENASSSWLIISFLLCIYSVIGLSIFPRRVASLRRDGFKNLFPLKIVFLQMGMLIIIFILSGLMILDVIIQKNNVYLLCLILFLIQSTIAFIRTMFVRVQ
jgi:hypothetical protein